MSPSFLEQYLSAARQVSVQALGNPAARTQSKIYPGPPEAGQYMHLEGLPLGTRGGMLIEHDFPTDGDYEFTISGLAGAGYLWGVMDPNTLIITVDGVRVFELASAAMRICRPWMWSRRRVLPRSTSASRTFVVA